MSDYNKKIKDADIEYVYCSTTPKGEVGSDYKPLDQFETITTLKDKVSRLENHIARQESVLESTLNALGVNTNVRMTNMSLLCSILLQAKLLRDNENYVAIESVDGYIKKATKIENVFKEEYVTQFETLLNGCYYIEDGEIKLDEEKYNEIMGAL